MEASVWFSGWIGWRSLASSAWCSPSDITPVLPLRRRIYYLAQTFRADTYDVVLVALEQLVRTQRLVDGDGGEVDTFSMS